MLIDQDWMFMRIECSLFQKASIPYVLLVYVNRALKAETLRCLMRDSARYQITKLVDGKNRDGVLAELDQLELCANYDDFIERLRSADDPSFDAQCVFEDGKIVKRGADRLRTVTGPYTYVEQVYQEVARLFDTRECEERDVYRVIRGAVESRLQVRMPAEVRRRVDLAHAVMRDMLSARFW